MRKIAAYLFGVFLLLMLGSVLLHPSLLIVGDWLGPILGNSVYEALTLTFLLLGDPLKFVSLLVIWVSVALVCGAVVRRRLGAVLIALLVWLTLLPITAAVVFDIAQKMPNLVGGGGGGGGVILAPLPTTTPAPTPSPTPTPTLTPSSSYTISSGTNSSVVIGASGDSTRSFITIGK